MDHQNTSHADKPSETIIECFIRDTDVKHCILETQPIAPAETAAFMYTRVPQSHASYVNSRTGLCNCQRTLNTEPSISVLHYNIIIQLKGNRYEKTLLTIS